MAKKEPPDIEIKKVRVTEAQSAYIDELIALHGFKGQSDAVRWCIQTALNLSKRRCRRAAKPVGDPPKTQG